MLGSAGLIVGLATMGPAAAAPAPAAGTTATYLVQLSDAPAASYTGGVPGYARTKPVRGKLDPAAPAVSRYRGYLRQRQDGVLRQASTARRLNQYSVAFNGFAATMTTADAAKLARTAGVKAVVKDEKRKLDTTRTPEFLGLTKPIVGLWAQNGGVRKAGEGVVVGSLDSGLWPESPSVAPLANPRPVPQFNGTCQTGEQWDASDCSTKVVGARYYTAGVTAGVGDIKTVFPYEYLSARDADGHGTHTATTAAGNNGVPVTIAGQDFGRASGMAPRARIATYKVCWGRGEEEAGCYNSDSVQAIEDATTDGVDVINFSISGSLTSSVDPVEVAFFGAADAGVFVATSAGNSGPGASTVAHNSPWLTTVAAGTLDRRATKSVTLGNGATYTGVGLGPAVPSSPLALSTSVALAGAPANDARLCFEGSLDPAKAAGKIIVCDRGVNDRIAKSREVQRVGGVGMVLTNTSPNSLNADIHYVPTVHVDEVAGAAIKAYIAGTAAPTASLSAGTQQFGVKAPQVAGLLLPRPGAVRRRRPAQAGHHGARRGHPRRRLAGRPRRPAVRLHLRHLDVQPAPGRHRRAGDPEAPGLVADGGQVGADDHRQPEGQHRRGHHHRRRTRRPGRSTTARATSCRTRRRSPAWSTTAPRSTGSATCAASASCPRPAARAPRTAGSTRATSTSRTSRSARWPASRR